MKKWLVPLVVLLALAFILGACAQPTSAPTSAPASTSASRPASASTSAPASTGATQAKILKFSTDMGETAAVVRGWKWFAGEFEKQTGGRYKIDFYPGGSLVKSNEQLNSLAAGVADFGNAGMAINSQAFPISQIYTMPSVQFPETPAGHAASLEAAQQVWAKYPATINELRNFKLFTWSVMPANIIMSKKIKIVVPSDLKGIKISCGGTDKLWVDNAGGISAAIPPPETYQNMEKGVVDASTVTWVQSLTNHYEEVAVYWIEYGFGQNVQLGLMNLNTWNSMPPDVQKILTDLVAQTQVTIDQNYFSDTQTARKRAQDKNCVITVPTPEQRKLWEKIVEPVDNQWLDQMKAKGVTQAPEMLNFLKGLSSAAWSKNQ